MVMIEIKLFSFQWPFKCSISDTAYAKHNGRWYLFNDACVQDVKDPHEINVCYERCFLDKEKWNIGFKSSN